MPKFAANLCMLYTEHSFIERFAAASADGFKAVEYVSPYEETPDAIAAELRRNGLTQALFNLPAGDWSAGERGIACLPDRVEEFEASVDTAIAYAQALDCCKINCLAGIAPAGMEPDVAEATLADNLRYAAERLAAAGISLVFEPINTRDIPGYFVATTDHAERIMDRVDHHNLLIQYDFYHMQIMQGDLLSPSRDCKGGSAMSRSLTIPAATSRAPARSTTVSFLSGSTSSATRAGWVVNTSLQSARARVSIGLRCYSKGIKQ